MSPTYDAVVIGAGHNGLVTAAYLARAGVRTLVVERHQTVGGSAVTESVFPGFRVDLGAHWFGSLHPAVQSDLALHSHGLEVIRADPTVFAPHLDGRHLLLWRSPRESADAIRALSQADADKWPAYCDAMAKIAHFLQQVYHAAPVHVPAPERADLWTLLRLARRFQKLGKRDAFELLRTLPMSAAELLDDWFETDLVKGTLAAAGTTGVLQGPMSAGTAFVMLHQLACGEPAIPRGAHFVRGGIGNLTFALGNAARAAGAEIRTSARVERIVVDAGRATGVVLHTGEQITARHIVSNADPRRTFLDLVGPSRLDPSFTRAVRSIKFRGAVGKVHLAVDALPNFTALPGDGPHLRGLISISPSLGYLEQAYDDAKYGSVSHKPYLEIVIPSLTDASLAPPGQHLLSIFVQYAPYHLDGDGWNGDRRDRLGDLVIETLAEYAPNIGHAVLRRHILTPVDLEERFDLSEGNIHHGEPTLDQLYFMRPVPGWARYRTPVENLYLCGAGTHPGGGITGIPGLNAAREMLRDTKR